MERWRYLLQNLLVILLYLVFSMRLASFLRFLKFKFKLLIIGSRQNLNFLGFGILREAIDNISPSMTEYLRFRLWR